jgi:hypothetical protein
VTDPFARLVIELQRDPENAYNLDCYEAELVPRCRQCLRRIPVGSGSRLYCDRRCGDLARALRRFKESYGER